MFDFAADARAEGGENGMNHKGLVTFDRKYKKTVFMHIRLGFQKNLYFIFVVKDMLTGLRM